MQSFSHFSAFLLIALCFRVSSSSSESLSESSEKTCFSFLMRSFSSSSFCSWSRLFLSYSAILNASASSSSFFSSASFAQRVLSSFISWSLIFVLSLWKLIVVNCFLYTLTWLLRVNDKNLFLLLIWLFLRFFNDRFLWLFTCCWLSDSTFNRVWSRCSVRGIASVLWLFSRCRRLSVRLFLDGVLLPHECHFVISLKWWSGSE